MSPKNAPQDRELTTYLYGGDECYRLGQEIVLGVGGFEYCEPWVAIGYAAFI